MILVIEIGFWKTIDPVVRIDENTTNREFAAQPIREHLPRLSLYMGTKYVEIVRFCLGYTNESFWNSINIHPNEELNITFKFKVVFPLKALDSR
jgi:hypothetical protein